MDDLSLLGGGNVVVIVAIHFGIELLVDVVATGIVTVVPPPAE